MAAMTNITNRPKTCLVFTFVTITLGLVGDLSKAGFDIERSPGDSSHHVEDGTRAVLVQIQPIVHAPSNPAQWGLWRKELERKRQEIQERIGYDDRLYRQPEFDWIPSCYSCCFLMMHDEAFYDRNKNEYTIDSLIDDGIQKFGGYDAIVLWHAYPRIGFDNRNQFDFYRDMPGGLEGLRVLSRAIHKRGIKVFINYNPWDTGTHREDKSDVDVLVQLVRTIEADGIFLDTLHEGIEELRTKLDAARPGVVLESELTLPVERIHDHHMSWAQWFKDSQVPGILWNKWFERRHMMHQIKRWNLDHSEELQMAWMNGSGILVWENVFGSWIGWSARDCSLLRAMLPIQRRFSRLFLGEGWTPLVETEKADVYASLWEGSGLRLWTLVNRSEALVEGVLLKVPHLDGARYFDLIAGCEITDISDRIVSIQGSIRPRGIGAFVSGRGDILGRGFTEFLGRQANLQSRASSDTTFLPRKETLRQVVRTKKYREDHIPDDMVAIPKARFDMEVRYRNRECGFYQVSQLDESTHPRHGLNRIISIKQNVQLLPYAIDVAPVTNAEFAEFLRATGYKPSQAKNFLKHWKNDAPPSGLDDHPVVYVVPELMQSGPESAYPQKRSGSMPPKVQTTGPIHGAISFKRAFATTGEPEGQPALLLCPEVVHHSAATTCAAMFGNGPKASEAMDEHGSALFVEVPSLKPKDQAGMRTEAHNPATLQRSLFSCGLGLIAVRRLVFAVW
jgi:hypothetical protein